jgi:hypothetical protein
MYMKQRRPMKTRKNAKVALNDGAVNPEGSFGVSAAYADAAPKKLFCKVAPNVSQNPPADFYQQLRFPEGDSRSPTE